MVEGAVPAQCCTLYIDSQIINCIVTSQSPRKEKDLANTTHRRKRDGGAASFSLLPFFRSHSRLLSLRTLPTKLLLSLPLFAQAATPSAHRSQHPLSPYAFGRRLR